MLKRIIILIALPLLGRAGGGLFAQSVQSGIVLEYQGEAEKTPMAGDAIVFKRIEKSGYEVMNREAVEAARVSRETSNIRSLEISIILCKTSLLNEIRDGYRTVAAQRYEKRMNAAASEIEKLKSEGRIREDEYNARMDSLEQAFEEQLASMETYIDRFARIDLSQLDETEKKIIALVQEGQIDEAIARYDDLKLTAKLRQNAEKREALRRDKEKLSEAEEEKRKEEDAIKASIERQEKILKDAE